jgi:hypothetical protein
MLSPILEKLTNDDTVKSGSGRALDLVTVDTDREFELAQKYKVLSLSPYSLPVAPANPARCERCQPSLHLKTVSQLISSLAH